jgi:RNA polymerase sigma factor (TIGR02999 family)
MSPFFCPFGAVHPPFVIIMGTFVADPKPMNEITQVLCQIEGGDPSAASHLLPLVYDELRKLAAAKLAREKPGQTLQATALVHEAYLRLVDTQKAQHWDSRGHFFAAAAEAIRRIIVENARRKRRRKHGAELVRHDVYDLDIPISAADSSEEIISIDEALRKLEATNASAARLVKLRYFAGFTIKQAAEMLGISSRKANQIWAYARVWLLAEIGEAGSDDTRSIPD